MSSWNALWVTVNPLHANVCVGVSVCVQFLFLARLFFNPLDYSLPKSSVWDFLAKDRSGLPFLPPGNLPDPGMEPVSPLSPALQADSLSLNHWGTNPHVENIQRLELTFHRQQEWVKLQLALHLLLLRIIQFYHFPPPLPPPGSNSSCLFTGSQSLCANYCIVLLYFFKYCTVRWKMFSLIFVCFSIFVWKVL